MEWHRPEKKALKNLIRHYPMTLVTGPRRIGKTELAKSLLPNATYLNFEDQSLTRFARNSPTEFFAQYKEPLILDDIQYAPDVFFNLQSRVNQLPTPGRFLAISTQNFSYRPDFPEDIMENCAIFPLYSVGWQTISQEVSLKEKEYILNGGFPELVLSPPDSLKSWFNRYIMTFLERDLRHSKNLGNLDDFEKFMRSTALKTAQCVSFSELGRDVGVSANTAKTWLQLLEASGFVYLLHPNLQLRNHKSIKSPKIYWTDTGLACHLMGITSWDQVSGSPLEDALWETYILGHWLRFFSQQGLAKPPLSHWRNIYGDQVSFLVENSGRYIGFQCQAKESPSEKCIQGFRSIQKKFGAQTLAKGYVPCYVQKQTKIPSYPFYLTPSLSRFSDMLNLDF